MKYCSIGLPYNVCFRSKLLPIPVFGFQLPSKLLPIFGFQLLSKLLPKMFSKDLKDKVAVSLLRRQFLERLKRMKREPCETRTYLLDSQKPTNYLCFVLWIMPFLQTDYCDEIMRDKTFRRKLAARLNASKDRMVQ